MCTETMWCVEIEFSRVDGLGKLCLYHYSDETPLKPHYVCYEMINQYVYHLLSSFCCTKALPTILSDHSNFFFLKFSCFYLSCYIVAYEPIMKHFGAPCGVEFILRSPLTWMHLISVLAPFKTSLLGFDNKRTQSVSWPLPLTWGWHISLCTEEHL